MANGLTPNAGDLGWSREALASPDGLAPAVTASSPSTSTPMLASEGIATILEAVPNYPVRQRHEAHRVSSVRGECLDWLLVVNRDRFRRVLDDVDQYYRDRPHRFLVLQSPEIGSALDAYRCDPGSLTGWRTDQRVLARPQSACP